MIIVPSMFITYSAAEILAAGWAEKFGQTIGINAKDVRLPGHVRISRAETDPTSSFVCVNKWPLCQLHQSVNTFRTTCYAIVWRSCRAYKDEPRSFGRSVWG